jgi:hypothetical protein
VEASFASAMERQVAEAFSEIAGRSVQLGSLAGGTVSPTSLPPGRGAGSVGEGQGQDVTDATGRRG